MALAAERRGKASGDVVRHASAKRWRAVPRRLVAAVAVGVCRSKRIVVVDMAVGALVDLAGWSELMRARQRPARGSVVEGDIGPQRRRVAGRAVGNSKGRAGGRMHGVVRTVVGRQVAPGIAAIVRLNGESRIVAVVALVAARDFSCRDDLVRVR